MSAILLSTYSSFNKISSTTVSTNYVVPYGEIYLTETRDVFFRCTICPMEECNYPNFLEHILTHCCSIEPEHKDEGCPTTTTTITQIKEEEIVELPDNVSMVIKTEAPPAENLLSSKDPLSGEEEHPLPTFTSNAASSRVSPSLSPPSPPVARRSHHKTDRPLTCEICGAGFRNWSNMHVHRRRHTGQRPYACSQCEMRFYTSTELHSHTRHRHTFERPFVCAYCGKDFFTSSHLRNHERRHSDYRPHKCDQCEKRFYDAMLLRDHMAVHTQERSHVCGQCSATFVRKKNLIQHMRLHANAREYKCDLCDKAFNQMPALWLHKKNRHKIIRPNARITKGPRGGAKATAGAQGN